MKIDETAVYIMTGVALVLGAILIGMIVLSGRQYTQIKALEQELANYKTTNLMLQNQCH